MAAPSATTRLFLLLGDPVAHSLSPRFQNAAIEAAELDALYGALRCDAQSVPHVIRALCRAGGGGNVTVPHKAIAAQCIERPSAAVTRTGACNTFWGDREGVICGDNTDVAGFTAAATKLLELRGAAALIVGAGGAAAAAVCALVDGGAASITLINRSPDRARTLAARLDPAQRMIRVVTSVRDLAGGEFDLVVNATSLGLGAADPAPLDLAIPKRVGAVLDLVYGGAGPTPWVRAARRRRIPAADGTEMLLAQGAAAFEQWFGRAPDPGVMAAALEPPPAT